MVQELARNGQMVSVGIWSLNLEEVDKVVTHRLIDSWPLRRYAKEVDCRPTFEVDKGEDRLRIDTILQKVQAHSNSNSKYITVCDSVAWVE